MPFNKIRRIHCRDTIYRVRRFYAEFERNGQDVAIYQNRTEIVYSNLTPVSLRSTPPQPRSGEGGEVNVFP